ncbi:MAG: hypothetical protein WD049_05495 [Candidatus Paceibacterota bacterium]
MTTVNWEKQAHSADVRMHLSVNGHVLSIGHLGPGYVILDTPIDHPPTDAEIRMSVDGKESRCCSMACRHPRHVRELLSRDS